MTARTGISLFGPLALSVQYNYLQTTTYDLNNFGSFTGYTTNTQPGVSIAGNTLTYVPPPRQQMATIIPISAIDPNGITVELTLKMYPNVTLNYTTNDFIGCDNVGNLYKINASTKTEALLNNFDGTPIVIANLQAMATNLNDGVLFYVLSTSPTTIRTYTFATKVSAAWLSGTSINISSMTYDNINNVLYAISSVDAQVVLSIAVPNISTFGYIVSFLQPFTSAGCTKQSIAIQDNNSNYLFISITPAVGNSTIQLCHNGNATGSLTSGFPVAAVTNNYLTNTPNGRLYCFSSSTLRFYSSRIISTFTSEWTSLINFISLARLPYGL